jgi:hypothetical protein
MISFLNILLIHHKEKNNHQPEPHALSNKSRFNTGEREMKTHSQSPSRETHEITINIHLSRQLAAVLIFALLALAAWALFSWDSSPAVASSPEAPADVSSTTGMRKYYLTIIQPTGNSADGSDGNGAGVCLPGYHFASVWELLDISNLQYLDDPINAVHNDDSGSGPPTYVRGWIRTGYNEYGIGTPGMANCNGWDSQPVFGTVIYLPLDWTNATDQNLHIWAVDTRECFNYMHVWCIED